MFDKVFKTSLNEYIMIAIFRGLRNPVSVYPFFKKYCNAINRDD